MRKGPCSVGSSAHRTAPRQHLLVGLMAPPTLAKLAFSSFLVQATSTQPAMHGLGAPELKWAEVVLVSF